MATPAGVDEQELLQPRSSSSSEEEEVMEQQRGNIKEPILEHSTIDLRRHAANTTSQVASVGSNLCPIESLDYEHWTAFWVFAGSNLALLTFATAITAFVSTAAGGSGIPEVKAYLNGVDAPDIFSLRTLVVKADPMVHTGACIGAMVGQGGSRKYRMTCRWLRYFKNDRDRRDLVTCGAAAGVAAALRAPVGGVLFALESLSSCALIWRAFFTTAVVAVTLRALTDICGRGNCGLYGKGGLITYDVTADTVAYRLADLPPVILLGVIGGVLGSLYNVLMVKVLHVCSLVNERGRAHRLLLAAAVSICISCCLFGLPWLAPCRPCSNKDCSTIDHPGGFENFQCPPEHYNDLASLFFNTNDDTIRKLYGRGTNDDFQTSSIMVAFGASYVLGILSYGVVAAPFGLFVPIMLTGASYGRLVGMAMGSDANLDHGLFAVLGSASFLGGTMRMTVSVCVIMLELTNDLLLLPLVMLVLLISKTVADAFNPNIYDLILRLKGLPYIEDHAEPYMRQLTVSDVVAGPLRTFNGVEKVGNVVHILKTTGHHAFPVIDEPPFSSPPVLYGLVLRAHLLSLLKKKRFLLTRSVAGSDAAGQFGADELGKRGSGKHDRVEDVEVSAEEMEMFVDLHPFTNSSPYTVVETMSLAKALILFREMGLRHLLIVPKSSSVSASSRTRFSSPFS
ncbi:hypothetical protein B296_00040046 [Ensete ventricosum]|uniref:CBS domain-containing protein n=1 Tax=Ensete ventricosum TaxID=4639 RepID=A0A426Y952_ENSVE|nr:hypothetical protein B296_00040046 [Ensete ventricosum]